MTDERQHDPAPPPRPDEQSAPADRLETVAETALASLAEARLPEPVKELVREALGDGAPRRPSDVGRIFLESVQVKGFRGIGRGALLKVAPHPGVNLVVGRNGSGKSSIAEGLEAAFTGRNPRESAGNTVRAGSWRNLHEGEPEVDVRLSIAGDSRSSTLSRVWKSEEFTDSVAVLKRPGHGESAFDPADWPLTDYRPFLSYADLDRMISGKQSEMYDAIAKILGLDRLNAAYSGLGRRIKTLSEAEKAVKEALPGLKKSLYELPDDERAIRALVAIERRDPDFDDLDSLVAGAPADAEAGLIARLRAEAAVQGPDLTEVGVAVDALGLALAGVEELHGTDAEEARHRADLLTRAVAHYDRHPDAGECPVCGTGEVMDLEWARAAEVQIRALFREAEAAQAARDELRSAVRAVQDLVRAPAHIPDTLAETWQNWAECRTIDDPVQLRQRAFETATILADVCAIVREKAVRELEERNERWCALVARLATWTEEGRKASANVTRRRELTKAQTWIKGHIEQLRAARMAAFTERSQSIWEELRQESNVDLTRVSLRGTERATVRKLVMDVTVDGEEAPALGVMSQGEQHSLALSLFLPRAAAAESPFGFVVIDDPVQSMDPAKVNGLARVLAELGRTRQVIVFTHDTRLQRAFATQELPVTVFQVERLERSRVTVKVASDPVKQALDDAYAIAKTDRLPHAAQAQVLSGLCRTALENAFLEAVWIRYHREGWTDGALLREAAASDRLVEVAALALFGADGRNKKPFQVHQALRSRYGDSASSLVDRCQKGAHGAGALPADLVGFVREVGGLAAKVRKPQRGPLG